MALIPKLRRSINRISLVVCLAAAPTYAEARYLTAIDGAYSIASRALPGTLSGIYSSDAAEYNFTDYGGRFYWLKDDYGIGVSLGLYSAFNARALLSATSGTTVDFVQRQNTASGSTYQFAQGNYRLGLGWVPLLARYRRAWFGDFLFAEVGTGPAYGFGALEYTVSATAATSTLSETRYHKYNEWGWMTSLMLGANFKLSPGLSLQVFIEGAWVYAKIRNPNLLQSDSISWSQYFVRPGLAVAFSF
ncbi:MAG: hypothetical protein U1F27_18195 [Turneriella sp.]